MRLKEYFDYTRYAEILHMTKFEIIFCMAYFVVALNICLYSTPMGSIFHWDSTGYAGMADNIYRNHKFLIYSPIYPTLIAIGMGLGLILEQSAGIVPIICYSLLGFPLFLLGKITSKPMAGYITCIICLICGKELLYISTRAMTDMVYLFISVIAMLFFVIYNKHGSLSSITFAGIFALLAALTRNIGITLVLAGIVVIIINNKELKKSLIPLLSYCLISIVPFSIWPSVASGGYVLTTASSNPPINVTASQFWGTIELIFYNDYKLTMLLVILFIASAIIYLYLHHHLVAFAKDTIPLTSYIFTYSIILILVTSSLWISVEGGLVDLRKVVQIYPFLALLVVSLFIYSYDLIEDRFYKIFIKTISIILLICLIAQGISPLNNSAKYIRTYSSSQYTYADELSSFISEYNLTSNNVIYSNDGAFWDMFWWYLYKNSNIKGGFIRNLDNISYVDYFDERAPAIYIEDLIKQNNNSLIYIIARSDFPRKFLNNSSKNINLCNLYRLVNPYAPRDRLFIYMAELKNRGSCSSNLFPEAYLIDNNGSSIKAPLAGRLLGQKHDQLLISNAKKDILQIIDFTKGSAAKIEYEDKPGTAWLTANHSLLSGDFMGLGYDQALHIAGGKIIIEDFSQGKAPAITRYSEAPARNSALGKLVDAGDAHLAGDFLGRDHSQVLFVDRKTRGGKLVIADFSKGKAPEMMQFSEIAGNSTLLNLMLDAGDRQFSGDFMGLGYSQLLMINGNHTRAGEPMIIIADFGKGKRSPSVRYQENWGESSAFGGWLDADDTQLVGDFMGLGHSRVLFVNHDHNGGKIMIVDFIQGKPAIRFWESWNKGTLFEGWLGLNDTKIAGDFKGLGYSQVTFLNRSINGTNAIIVDFINGKPMIAL